MKNQLRIVSFILVLAVFGCKNHEKDAPKEEASAQESVINSNEVVKDDNGDAITLISAEEAQKLLRLENTQLVDVRTLEELESGKIAGAVNMIYQKNFKEKIASLDKTKPVVVYCRSGRRSAICAEVLKEAGFEKIYDLEGGITQWVKEGRPLVE